METVEQTRTRKVSDLRMKRHTARQQPPWARQDCRLLQLPAEIRNQIWRLALVDEDRIDLKHTGKPRLTQTCRQIEAEALPMFFFDNRFSLNLVITPEWREQPCFESTKKWVARAQKRGIPILIRDVYFTFTRPDQPTRFAMHLLPKDNYHFNTPISFFFTEDYSDFPICTGIGFGGYLRDLAESGREGFTFDEIRRIKGQVRFDQMFGLHIYRWIGQERLKRWERRAEVIFERLVPDSWFQDTPRPATEPKCKCSKCRSERKKARKVAKKNAKRVEEVQ